MVRHNVSDPVGLETLHGARGIGRSGVAKPSLEIGLGFPVRFARSPFRPPPNWGLRTSEIGSRRVARQSSLVHLAAVCNAGDADKPRCVVDNVRHPPVAGPNAPLILVALQLLASRGPRRPENRFSGRLAPARCPATPRVPSARPALRQRNSQPRIRPRFKRSALIFSSGIPFSWRRDSEISPSRKSSNLAPCFLRSI